MPYFKYMSFERFGSLRHGRIRFTQPGAFNDPFEMPSFKAAEAEAIRAAGLAGLVEQTDEILSGLMQGRIPSAAFKLPINYWLGAPSDPPRANNIPSEKAIEKIRLIDKTFGILSLSSTPTNLLLWAHYAAEHRGLAVEIDPNNHEFNRHNGPNDRFELARPVQYSNNRPRIPETDEILFEHFFTKSLEWSYELEFRIVRKLESRKELIEAEPFPIHLYELPPSAIRRVIFGARSSPDLRSSLIREMATDRSFAHVLYAEAVLRPNSFGMEILQLGDSSDQIKQSREITKE